jgi:hypothetical protein
VPLGYRSETMVTRDKEQLIRKLLKEGKNWNYICKEARCSPNTIEKVNQKSQIRAPKIKSKRSDALQMYHKGYSPLDIAVKLDISADEAESYKIEYWKLKNMDDFEAIYKKYKNAPPNKINLSIENKKAFQSIWKSINEILGDKNQLLWVAALSIFRAAENNPNLKAAFSYLVGMDKAISIKLYDFRATIKPELGRAADIIYDEIYNRLVEMAAARL